MTGEHTHASGARDRAGTEPNGAALMATVAVPEQLLSQVQALTDRFAAHMQQGLMAASVELGLDVLAELMRTEAAELTGPKGKHDAERTHVRHGTERGSVVLGGRRVRVRRPRVRTADERAEATSSSYVVARASDLLTEHTVAAMPAGLSTRRYDAALEPVCAAAQEHLPLERVAALRGGHRCATAGADVATARR